MENMGLCLDDRPEEGVFRVHRRVFTDPDIFERYSRLAGDLHPAYYARIRDEFDRTRSAVLAIKGRFA